MQPAAHFSADLLKENEALRIRLEEAEDMLRALRGGDADAVVVQTAAGPLVYTLQGQDAEASRLRGGMLEQVSDAVFTVDESGLATFLNASAERLYGLTASEALGRPLADVFSTRWPRPNDEAAAETALREHGKWHGETVHVRRDGHATHVEASITGIKGEDGQETGRIAVIRDVSERKQAEARLRASEELAQQQLAEIEQIYASAQVGLCVLDRELRFRRINDRLAEINGVPARDHIGRTILEVLPDLAEFAAEMTTRVIGNGESIRDFEISGETQPGVVQTWIAQWLPLLDAQGDIIGINVVVEEVTERKRAEEAVRTSEVRYRRLFEAAHDGVLILDADTGQITDANPFMLDVLGMTQTELLGQELWQIGFLGDEAASRAALAELKKKGQVRYENLPLESKAGIRREVEVVANVYNEGGHQVIQCNVRDISERVRATEALRASEARLRVILDGVFAFIGVLDVDGTLREANAHSLSAGGLTRDDVVGRKFWDCPWWCHDNDEVERLKTAVAKAAAGEIVRYDAVIRVAGDMRRSIDFILSPVLNADGRVQMLVPSGVDISDRLQAQESLRESEAQLRFSLNAASAGSWDWHLPSDKIMWSRENSALYDIEPSPDGPRYADWEARVHPDDREPTNRAVRDVVEGRAAEFKAEFRIVRRDGTVRWLLGLGNIQRASDGSPLRMSGINVDITERKRQEEQIRLLMGEVNHRAKNMLSLVQAIARRTVATRPEDFIEHFGQRLQALAASQDLLIRNEWKAVPLGALVRSQLAHFGDALDTRVTLDGPPVEITAAASQALGMALHELVTNAAKYGALSNGAGRVAIGWNLRSDAAGEARFTMSWIESRGPSVAKPTRQGFGSTMIGAMIKMSLGCDAEVDFASTGFVWRIDCPAARIIEGGALLAPRSNGAAAEEHPAEASGRRRVLVVEDEPLIAMDMAHTVAEAGYEVIGPAHSVAMALALIAGSGCDAAVLDINLGAETAEPVARELIGRGTPFIVISGYAHEQRSEMMRTGTVLGKPVKSEALIAEIERCLAHNNA